MTDSVFDHSDYVEFLKAVSGPEGTRNGLRLAMARAMNCHSSYLTKVLNRKTNLSLEQALSLAPFLQMTSDEAEYFLLMIEKSRAGTKALEHYFQSKLEMLHQKRLVLKNRVAIKRSLNGESQSTYYGSWHFAAIHMALTVPGLRTPEKIARYFGVSKNRVEQTLAFLMEAGLAILREGQYEPVLTELHLGSDAPSILKHHTNWRIKTIESFDHRLDPDLHYTGVFTLSRLNASKLRERLVKTIQESISYATGCTDEEEVFCFSLDFFGLRRAFFQSGNPKVPELPEESVERNLD